MSVRAATIVSGVFAYQGLATAVESSDPGALAWLEEFLAPGFARADDARPDRHVSLVDDGQEYGEVVRRTARRASTPVACFTVDRRLVSFPSWRCPTGGRTVFDDDSHVFYLVGGDGATIRILADRERPSRRIPLMRVVREIATVHAWAADGLVVHGAAVALGDRGAMIAGPKGAGKTSLLLHFLLHAPGARFVSNDRVVVDLEAAPVLRGMPTVATIKEHSLDLFPELEPRLGQRRYDARLTLGETAAAPAAASWNADGRVGLAPAQFCEVVGADTRGSAPADVLLLPRVRVGDHGISLTEISPRVAADAVKACLIGGGPAPLVSEVFGAPRRGARGIDAGTLDRRALAFTEHVRCFECRLGSEAYGRDSAARLVDRLLGRGR